MCGWFPKILWVILVDLADDRPRRPGLVSRRRRAQNFDDLLFPLVPVSDVGFDIVRAIFNDGSVARVELGVLGHSFRECLVVVAHFLETGHVCSKILENRGSIAEDGVCCKEGFVEWEVGDNRVGSVTGRGEYMNGSQIGACGVTLVDGHWQLKVVCEVMPRGTRRRLSVIFYRNGPDVVVQGQVLGLKWELPQPGGFKRFHGGGIPFGPPLPEEVQDTTDPLVMVGVSMGDNNF